MRSFHVVLIIVSCILIIAGMVFPNTVGLRSSQSAVWLVLLAIYDVLITLAKHFEKVENIVEVTTVPPDETA